jgi:hypothetical protein
MAYSTAEIWEHNRANAIASHVSGTISLIASMTLLAIILRSRDGLSTTFHRLLFGLCISDIMSSLSWALSSSMVPRDMDYLVWNAKGNIALCNAQGIFMHIGVTGSFLYNFSLCFYYLAIVRYSKKDTYIKNKLEPWFHGTAILFSIAGGVAMLANGSFSAGNGPLCACVAYDPPHCIGYRTGDIPEGFTIPCGQGGSFTNTTLRNIFFAGPLILTPIVIIVTMTLMYTAVLKTEKKSQKYAFNRGTIRMPHHVEEQNSNRSGETNPSLWSRIKKQMKCLHSQLSNTSRSRRRVNSKSRLVRQRALVYSLAYFATYTFFIVMNSMTMVNSKVPFALNLLSTIFVPLHGFFNFLVYIYQFIYPKVLKAKTSKKNKLSWGQAFMTALTSGGENRTSKNSHSDRLRPIGRQTITTRKKRSHFPEKEKPDTCSQCEPLENKNTGVIQQMAKSDDTSNFPIITHNTLDV